MREAGFRGDFASEVGVGRASKVGATALLKVLLAIPDRLHYLTKTVLAT
jgi:hypothetical protein